ncbi:MAG: hydroxyethylthiazole kinase [Mangrovibacterium sp.]
MISAQSLSAQLQKVREVSPLIHNITNYVVMNNTANALLAVGASPVMAHALEEVEDMVQIASALVLNMGTLDRNWVKSMILAGKKALDCETPIVFDPVGVGATPYRTEVAHEILKAFHPTVIRGNASEIMALCREDIVTKGVDSSADSNMALQAAQQLAKENHCVVVVSGQQDIICDEKNTLFINNGHPMMAKVTGMGCTSTAMVATFVAVGGNTLRSASHAMSLMSIAGELAVSQSSGPGSLQMNFIDKLYNITSSEIEATFK